LSVLKNTNLLSVEKFSHRKKQIASVMIVKQEIRAKEENRVADGTRKKGTGQHLQRYQEPVRTDSVPCYQPHTRWQQGGAV
jgi:hypothetical protein